MEKEKIIQDERNMFINVIYITTGLTMAISTCKNFVHYFCTEENDLYIKFTYSACWCINFLLFFSFFYLFLLFSARMWLAKRSSCPAISCSWAATRLASIVVLLISIALCFNLSSFSWNSFSFFSISFFLSSISMTARQLRTSVSSSGDGCKND